MLNPVRFAHWASQSYALSCQLEWFQIFIYRFNVRSKQTLQM